jgi:hypothetical protein
LEILVNLKIESLYDMLNQSLTQGGQHQDLDKVQVKLFPFDGQDTNVDAWYSLGQDVFRNAWRLLRLHRWGEDPYNPYNTVRPHSDRLTLMISLPPDPIRSSLLSAVESEEDLQLGKGRRLYDLRLIELISSKWGEEEAAAFIRRCLSCEGGNYLYARVWDRPGRYSEPPKTITPCKTFQTSSSVKSESLSKSCFETSNAKRAQRIEEVKLGLEGLKPGVSDAEVQSAVTQSEGKQGGEVLD